MARKNSNPPPYRQTSGRWGGQINFRGKQHWVGTFDTPEAWKVAAAKLLLKLEEAHQRQAGLTGPPTMTVREYVEAGWPDTHTERRQKESTFANHRYMIKKLVKAFGDRPLRGGILRSEARHWANSVSETAVRSARSLFYDAIEDDLTEYNPFAGLRLSQKLGRRDINVLTADELDALCAIPIGLWPGNFGQVMSTLLRWSAETGMRPGELCALSHSDVDLERNLIYCRYQRSSSGEDTTPKVQLNSIVLPPRAKDAYLTMPRLDDQWVFTTQRGQKLQKSMLHHYWLQIRLVYLGTLPAEHWLRRRKRKFDMYELRHFAATWLGEDPPYGLGLSPRDIAQQFGHKDGGVRVMRLYGHPDQRQMRSRIQEAFMRDYELRQQMKDAADAGGEESPRPDDQGKE